jgi:hypothetical protein
VASRPSWRDPDRVIERPLSSSDRHVGRLRRASSPGVQEAPLRRRVCVFRGGAVSGRNLSHKIPSGIDYPRPQATKMPATVLALRKNLSHNVGACFTQTQHSPGAPASAFNWDVQDRYSQLSRRGGRASNGYSTHTDNGLPAGQGASRTTAAPEVIDIPIKIFLHVETKFCCFLRASGYMLKNPTHRSGSSNCNGERPVELC